MRDNDDSKLSFKVFFLEQKDKDDPCWKDYTMIGFKIKKGKKVPNCVPKDNETDRR